MHWKFSPTASPAGLVALVALVALVVAIPAPAAVAQDDADAAAQHLPTPYTAEEIRDAWFEGFEVLTFLDLPQGERHVLTTVLEWSQDEVTLEEQPVSATGEPQGEPRVYTATWQDLRNHALFPASQASRQQVTRSTPLGELEGWLYRVEQEDGSVSEFFFADGMAGAPVVAQRVKDGETLFQVIQLERSERPAETP